MPKVSVIIPVYGVEKYIERCARSLFEQTLDDIEYLFIDDCTPDRSIEILKEVLENYTHRKSQVIIHRMDTNSGQAAVRKWGMQNATGEYVIHCDSDDWVDVEMYEKMYKTGVEESADLVVCDYYETNGKENKYVRNGNVSHPNFLFEYFQLWIRMIKRDVIRKITVFPTGNMGEDRVYAVQTGWYSQKIVKIDIAYYYYFINEQSICNNPCKENYMRNFWMRQTNVLDILSFIKEKQIKNQQEWLIQLKWQTLSWLVPLISEKDMLKLWKNTFPELRNQMLCVSRISLRDKIKYYVIYSGIYTTYKAFIDSTKT